MKFAETKRVFEFNLGDGLKAKGLVYKDKEIQEEPNAGDRIIANAELRLPIKGDDDFRLHPSLQFGDRCRLDCERLTDDWGSPNSDEDGNYRFRINEFKDLKWKTAFDKAQEHIFKEMGHLLSALESRRKALEDADEI